MIVAPRFARLGTVAVLMVFGMGLVWAAVGPTTSAYAQENTAAGEAQPAAPAPSSGEAADGAGDADESFREQTIYIPYEKLRDTFEKEGRGVYLPYEEFRKLWEAAREKPQPPQPAESPRGAIINEVRNEATVQRDVVRVKATLSITLLREGWQTIPLRLSDVAVTRATYEGKPARLIAENGHQLLIEHTGKEPQDIEVEIEFAKAITHSPGRNSVAFEVPQAPISRWRIHVLQEGVKVQISPMLAASEVDQMVEQPPEETADEEPADEPGGGTELLAFVGATPTVTLQWTPKAEGATGLEALAGVQTEQQLFIAEGVLRTRAQLTYTISRSEIDTLEVAVPADQKVVSVFDANVRQWTVEAGGEEGGSQVIRVQLFEPAKESQRLVIELEQLVDQTESVTLPVIEARNVVRQQGVVVVRVEQGLRAEPSARSGLLQIDAAELPGSLAGESWQFMYRYVSLPVHVEFAVEKVQPLITAESWTALYFHDRSMAGNMWVVYEIERAGVFELALEIPEHLQSSVHITSVPWQDQPPVPIDQSYRDPEDPTRWIIKLSRQALGKAAFRVMFNWPYDEKEALSEPGESLEVTTAVPLPDRDALTSSTGWVALQTIPSFRVTPTQTEGLRVVAPSEAYGALADNLRQQFTPSGNQTLVQMYAFAESEPSVTLSLERRRPQVHVSQLLSVAVEDRAIKYDVVFHYDVQYSGVKSLRIDVPESVSEEIRNTTPDVRDQRLDPQPEDVEEGYVAWEFTGPQEFLNKHDITLTWTRELSNELDQARLVPIEVPRLVPQQVDQSWGQILIRKAENIDVREGPDLEGVRAIDPQRDLMAGVSGENAAGAFEFHGPWTLSLLATRYRVHPAKQTSIERGLLRAVVTRSGTISVQAIYRIRSVQQRLAVELPPGAKLDAEQRLNGKRFNPEMTVDSEGGSQSGAPTGPPAEAPARDGSAPGESPPAAEAAETAAAAEAGSESPDGGSRGDAHPLRRYYVPLVDVEPDEPFVLELRYSMPGDAAELPMVRFPVDSDIQPEAPAVQKVYAAVYLPEESKLLARYGQWTDEYTWQRHNLRMVPQPKLSPQQLLDWASEPIEVADFPVDGALYLFSAVDPAAPPDGTLRLVTVDYRLFDGFVLVVTILLGLLLLPFGLRVRVAVVAALVIAWIVCAVFAQTLAGQIAGNGLAGGVGVVIVLWGVQGLRCLCLRCCRRGAREGPPPPTAPEAARQPDSPKPGDEPADSPFPSDEDNTPVVDETDDASDAEEGVELAQGEEEKPADIDEDDAIIGDTDQGDEDEGGPHHA